MSKRKKNKVSSSGVAKLPHTVPITKKEAPNELRNFGLLTTRSVKIKQGEAIIRNQKDLHNQFSKMPSSRLIEIVKGNDISKMRELSKFFAQTNGVYSRSVRYLADIFRFDFMIYPNLNLDGELTETENKEALKKLNLVLEHFDNSAIQLMGRKWATQVCLEGVYHGYICDDISDKFVVQDLPSEFCRSRFLHRGLPLIEFNVQYFDKATQDLKFREQLLNLFPEEFKVGYINFKNGNLEKDSPMDDGGWILLDNKRAFKFNFSDNDIPPFLYAIPSIIELGEVQDIEKEKLLQKLQKVLVQKFELDKNGEIPFSMSEIQQLNQNALDILGESVGTSVLSTVASVHLEDFAGEGEESTKSVNAAEGTVYNELGISMNLFNTTGNLALEKSIIVDESFVKPLLLQLEQFFNNYISWKFNKKDLKFRMKMLTTTLFNYKDLSSTYKELTEIGFSRFLPMIALGHSQKEVASMAKLEQEIMEIDKWMLPPFSSNVMSADIWSNVKATQKTTSQMPNMAKPATTVKSDTGGRAALPDDKKSDKTIANQASK